MIPRFDALNGNIEFVGDKRQGLSLSNSVAKFTNLVGVYPNKLGFGLARVFFLEDF